jgi:hypothetical protein
MFRSLLLYMLFLLFLSPNKLLSAPLEFSRSAEFGHLTVDQAAAVLVDFANMCDSGCQYYHKGLVESVVYEQTEDRLLIWQKTNEVHRSPFMSVIMELIRGKFSDFILPMTPKGTSHAFR